MEAITEETAGFRQATQSYLVENRAEMESLIHESTDRLMEQTRVPAEEAHSWQTKDSRAANRELLKQYLEAGGTVLAAPIYRADARSADDRQYALRGFIFSRSSRRDIHLAACHFNLQHLLDHRSNGLWIQALAVQKPRWGHDPIEKNNRRINTQGEDLTIWKWLFCELGEGEDLNTLVTEKERWGWGGKFTWGTPLERERAVGAWTVTCMSMGADPSVDQQLPRHGSHRDTRALALLEHSTVDDGQG
ncbi:uncharacterized protein EAF02_011176 [Botrytis sinoallii]|uniref:uncharacterized protein n=1 Tax=Botrytis sinoallii TaxID=1463999 RepID=UPI0018FFA735|nr:uncharacterized protein EAF02_011176 [Botrytis sinoallii]KAF7857809.1 hypothetical protein EAF02_011176 [Botrytis sinoallii]